MVKNGVKKTPKVENMASTVDGLNDQSFVERRTLRNGYLSIQSFIHEKRDEIGAANSKNFLSIINEVDEMHHLVKKPREQLCDAEALRELADTLVTSIRVHTAGSVTPSLFVSSLINEYGQQGRIGNTENAQILWKDIGLHVSPFLMFCRGPCTMLGPMRYGIKSSKVMVRRKRSRSSVKEEKVKPEELENTASKEKTQTEKIISMMFDLLRSKRNVHLENLILNRTSFAQTVENLFALSFLVKDGRVAISVDEKGRYCVSPKNAPASSAVMSGKVVFSHFIFGFGFNDWKLMKNLVAEGSELLPHRNGCQSEPEANHSQAATRTMTPIRTPSMIDTNGFSKCKRRVTHSA